MDLSLKIEKLRDKENWQQWRFVMRTLLEDDDEVLAVCEGTTTRPADTPETAAALKQYLLKDKVARKLIVTAVEKKPMELIMNCTTAREMWAKLNAVYDMRSEESIAMVQKQFFDFKWCENESVAHNLSKVEQIASKLRNLNSEVSDGMLVTRVLTSLPRKFCHFHSAWDSMAENRKNFENLTSRLMTEELRVPVTSSEKQSTALVAENSAKSEKPMNSKASKKCHNCGKVGHFKRDCFRCYICKEKGHKSNTCPKKKDSGDQRSSNYAGRNRGDSSKGEKKIALFGSRSDSQDDIWIIDSGATDRMSRRRDWFSTFEEFPVPEEVSMCNGKSMNALGKGNVDFECYVNDQYVTGTLKNVLYIPDIVHNLFSVKSSGRKGIDFVVKNNATECFLIKDNEILIVCSKHSNLFKLNIKILIPKECNVMNKKDSASLRVWHERLWHQNVKHVKSFFKAKNIDFLVDEFDCEGCAYGKLHRNPFHEQREFVK